MAGLTEAADLVVEDGTGLADANSYIAIAPVTAYHRLRCNTAWAAATESDQVAALIRATDYVDRRWTFVGTQAVEGQALAWPRGPAVDSEGFDVSDTVPAVIETVTAEYALRALDSAGLLDNTTPLLPDPSREESFITFKKEVVGPLEETTRFSEQIPRTVIKSYPLADRLLLKSGLVRFTGSGVIR